MDEPRVNVIVFRSRVAAECRERSVVLKSMNIEHVVRRRAGEWMLEVPEHQVAVAVRQLDDYVKENRDWPRTHPALPRHPFGLTGVASCVAALLFVSAADHHAWLGLDWFGAGRVDTDLVRRGEWWRSVTALTLHVDAGHLIGNLLLGSVFGMIAGRLLGNGLAWFSIVTAGAVGNEISALVQLPLHTAVGASTAVFAALGLLSAYVWRRRHELQMRWATRWAPVVVAAILLAYTGSGDERTDVVSHLTGFLAGIALGAYYGSLARGIMLGARSQWLLGLGTLAVVVVSWAIALGSHG
ncbi:MAG: rhomboid family intramembrane serine protease [Planctomycetes bacterium]|nr:rhomboid family intramembrane serine protease [Planctomycetota bacterium]